MRLIRAKIRYTRRWIRRTAATVLALNLAFVAAIVLWKVLLLPGAVVIIAAIFAFAVDAALLTNLGKILELNRPLQSAQRRNVAETFDVRATRFVLFEKIEDEGADYAFELGDNQILFVHGQDFYPTARFPCLNFSIVHLLDELGKHLDIWIEKRSAKAAPGRVIPAETKKQLTMPRHLEIRSIAFGDIERHLRRDAPKFAAVEA